MEIDIQRHPNPGKCPEGELGFGQRFTDHMFLMDWGGEGGEKWHSPRIVPYAPLTLDPAASVLHYAQAIFEGTKAFHGDDGKVRLFRADANGARFARSAERMCMQTLPVEAFVESIRRVVDLDRAWIPQKPGTSLYVRPTMIASEPFLGVRPAREYLYYVILSPVGAYYKSGLGPVRIFIEREMVRAAPGGTGEAKCAGNYAASLFAARRAAEKGCAQVLWTDAKEHRYIEEVGTSNLFVKIGDEVITAPLEGTILPGVTRDCVIAILKDKGIPVIERKLSVDEIKDAAAKGTLEEAFGTGTAAVISPVGTLVDTDGEIEISKEAGPLCQALYDEITGIQYGRREDRFGWTTEV